MATIQILHNSEAGLSNKGLPVYSGCRGATSDDMLEEMLIDFLADYSGTSLHKMVE